MDQNQRDEDYEKLNKIVAAISSKGATNPKATIQPYEIENAAKDLILDHILEVVCSTIEGAATLAKHRGADSVSMGDVQLMLGNSMN